MVKIAYAIKSNFKENKKKKINFEILFGKMKKSLQILLLSKQELKEAIHTVIEAAPDWVGFVDKHNDKYLVLKKTILIGQIVKMIKRWVDTKNSG
jgi:hypothetical protein